MIFRIRMIWYALESQFAVCYPIENHQICFVLYCEDIETNPSWKDKRDTHIICFAHSYFYLSRDMNHHLSGSLWRVDVYCSPLWTCYIFSKARVYRVLHVQLCSYDNAAWPFYEGKLAIFKVLWCNVKVLPHLHSPTLS